MKPTILPSLYPLKAWLLMLLIMAAPVLGSEPLIVIISSSEAQAYQQTVQAFKTSLKQSQPNVEFVQSDAKEIINDTQPAALIFALGSRAVQHSLTQSSERELLATMILNAKVLQDTSHATAVLLKTSISKQLQWHRRFLPKAKKIGILYDPQYNQEWLDKAKISAGKSGLEIIAVPVKSAKDLPSALKVLGRSADSILGIADKTVYSGKTAKAVLLFSFRNRIPFIGLSGAWVKAGALYAFGWDYPALGQQCAAVASRILNGEKAGLIEPQLPNQQHYLINLKTAQQMKLDINQDLIDGAFKVYK